jgi:hypothetical protein
MSVRLLQGVLMWLHRHFACWHEWRGLKYHGLPNEPVLAQCCKCGYITGAIL